MIEPAEPSTPSGPPNLHNEGDRSRATKTRQVHPLRTDRFGRWRAVSERGVRPDRVV